MSAGGFVRARYQLDDTSVIVPLRVQQETIDFTANSQANSLPTGDVTLSVSAKARKGNREGGIGCRNISISWTAGAPTGYKDGETLIIPVLTPAAFAAYNVGNTGTYLGTACEIVSKKSEALS